VVTGIVRLSGWTINSMNCLRVSVYALDGEIIRSAIK